ncbi:MAG: hypothetical protein R3D33_00635 [Hyphomicrobiaceae bacterium]
MTVEDVAAKADGGPAWPDRLAPSETRYLAAACRRFGYRFRIVDGDGYLIEIGDGNRTIVVGAGRASIYPVNSAAAFTLTKDKRHTATLLDDRGIANLGGELFFVSGHHRRYRGGGREAEDALAHADAHGYPLFAKPNLGARGDLAEIVPDRARLAAYLAEAATRYDAILLQDVVAGREYRVLTLDNAVIYAVERADAQVMGDGATSLSGLIAAYNAGISGTGISEVPEAAVARIAATNGVTAGEPVARGRVVVLPGRRNLSAAGHGERLMVEDVPPPLARIARAAAAATGLVIAGIDVIDCSAAQDLSDLRVMEVNGAPGLMTLEALGRMDLIEEIWRRVLALAFGATGGA